MGWHVAWYDFLTSTKAVKAEALFFGTLNDETRALLSLLGLELPLQTAYLPDNANIVLVDTHHLAQLPQLNRPEAVVDIIDHHMAGDPESFPNAQIQNEAVGAAATLVAERCVTADFRLSPAQAGLLAGAIFSNTLAFTAPGTHKRDKKMFARLSEIGGWSTDNEVAMIEAKNRDFAANPAEKLFEDGKVFEISHVTFLVYQSEIFGLFDIVKCDLIVGIFDHSEQFRTANTILNCVDVKSRRSLILTNSERMFDILKAKLDGTLVGNCGLLIKRICQRKTDIVPFLA